jgi:hypothetical protein
MIPAMDHIDEHPATAAIDNCYPLAIKAALALARKLLTATMIKLITLRFLELPWIQNLFLFLLHPHYKL